MYTFAGTDRELTKFQHIERLGHEDCEGLLDGDVYVQEKLDGANMTVAYDPAVGVVVASRNNVIAVGGEVRNAFDGACDYIAKHEGLPRLFEVHPIWVLRGEWLKRHSIAYAPQNMKRFYVFDVQDGTTGEYIHPDVYGPVLGEHGICVVPIFTRLTSPKPEDLALLVPGPGDFGAVQKEGIVIKRIGFTNKWGRTTWGKMVAEDFKVANKVVFGPTRHDEVELQFAARATREFVLKEIHKLEEVLGRKVEARDIKHTLDTCWHVLFHEELWDFAKKHKGVAFDFGKAEKLVTTAVRNTVLAYVNGLEVEDAANVA